MGFNLNLNFNCDLDQPRISNSKSGDVAPLNWDYCSLIIRASQFSSTTRNLVPRFKRGVRGKALVTTFKWISSKKSIPFVDVFKSLFQSIMMKLSSFLQELHRTYERIRGSSATTECFCGIQSGVNPRMSIRLPLELNI